MAREEVLLGTSVGETMEALLVRIDHFHDRRVYVSTVKSWLEALGAPHARLVTMGDVHLLFVEAPREQNDALLANFAAKNVDTNARGEPCTDRFIDVVGRKAIAAAVCKGFLEMNVLNATLLERLMVTDWHCEKEWLDDALSTPRTKALLQWKEDAKNARKDRRKRAAVDRQTERAAKKAKAEEDKAREEAAKQEDRDDNDSDKEGAAKVADASTSIEEGDATQAAPVAKGLVAKPPQHQMPGKPGKSRPQHQSKPPHSKGGKFHGQRTAHHQRGQGHKQKSKGS